MKDSKIVQLPTNMPLTRSVMETRLLTLAEIERWVQPPFQRPIRMNAKVMQFAEDLKAGGGIMGGILTLGRLPKDPSIYKVDGAHRIEAAKTTGLTEFLADIRTTNYATMAEMAEDFVALNSSLVRMRPDDLLRGLEETTPMLKLFRTQCSFIGYDNVRRGSTHCPLISASAALRCWFGSASETPKQTVGASTALCLALNEREVQDLSAFFNAAYTAWGNDAQNYKLWGALNISICMWAFRQLVLNPVANSKRHITLNVAQFTKCLMALSADKDYVEWLTGRNTIERDRSPCYKRMRTIFSHRLLADPLFKKPKLPSPEWSKD